VAQFFSLFGKKKKQQNINFESTDDIDENNNEIAIINDYAVSNYGVLKENILFYIGGYIVKKLLSYIDCYTCASSLQKQKSDHNYVHSSISSKFLDFTNNGGLIIPDDSVFNPFAPSAAYMRHPLDDLCVRAPHICGIHSTTCRYGRRIYAALK